MIVYNDQFKLIGMGKKALEILGYESLDDFLSLHNDLDDIIQGTKKDEKVKFLQTILSSTNNLKKLFLKTKTGHVATAIAKAHPIYLEGFKKMYELELIHENTSFSEDEAKNPNENSIELRLPLLLSTQKKEIAQTYKPTFIDEKWLETTRNFLHLEKDEFVGYLKLYIQNVRKNDIAIQSAMMAYNTLGIKKLISKLKEPAMNLHITPLVKIYTDIQNSDSNDLSELILNAKDFIDELDLLLRKYQGNI
ncbi:hypothetical protein [Campylobacter gastrosuis]|uniref:Uncharacterized protein n=1 Tax=Campylobacter gastrosuis TaxID=2974576 RepID=A0ABT7HQ70_9BACT|nr:hypothetical protein [Campylobacter gastrosuis]MDL0089061.1 hypothetical protein [Campylobacter gastrosuis]